MTLRDSLVVAVLCDCMLWVSLTHYSHLSKIAHVYAQLLSLCDDDDNDNDNNNDVSTIYATPSPLLIYLSIIHPDDLCILIVGDMDDSVG